MIVMQVSYPLMRNIICQILSTCEFSNSRSVGRPKILTSTLIFFLSALTSLISPVKPVKGPKLTFTLSPTI